MPLKSFHRDIIRRLDNRAGKQYPIRWREFTNYAVWRIIKGFGDVPLIAYEVCAVLDLTAEYQVHIGYIVNGQV